MFTLSAQEEKIDFEGFTFKYILKERTYDTNHLIVVFSGFGGKSNFTYDFLNALQSSRAYVLWIKDDFYDNDKATYYLDPVQLNCSKLETAIVGFIENVLEYLEINRKNCTFLGCSKGGSSALYYGIKYNFSNIVVSAPTLLIGSSVAGIIPEGNIKNMARFLLGQELDQKNIKLIDDKIIEAIEEDNDFDKNIYLLSSQADPKYLGQVKPFLGHFHKYYNFNFIESKSVLVRTHQDVTYYNAPLILSILGCLTFNATILFKNSIIYGDKIDKYTEVTKEPFLKIRRLDFDKKGFFYPEGVFFLKGVPCAEYRDLKYILKLKNKNNVYEINLAKMENKKISKNYYEGSFVNYDKAYFCTPKHEGLDMSDIDPGIYQLYIEINMRWTKDVCELPLDKSLAINSVLSSLNKSEATSDFAFCQRVFSKGNNIYYSKKK